ncbi:type III PLP-dependent enzyme [Denitrobaculum tricleocarpae]|uniref:ornithine decarboxylase n=1 Tax=Denitrobaculum tricleocarpae TaxID=2591009 RepID=A0A545TTK1_9PROT|nr:type III PLP-dependent enzyme [Denitrobaculum tricleocarpae]TQV80545.1 type III PLP-dependent enzyme [Denitrobaculum tricleocarpae]
MRKDVRRFADADAVVRALEPSYPIFCLRPDLIRDVTRRFLAGFPGKVLYALKCNPHPLVLSCLYEAGVRHFDTASLPEIAQVAETYDDASCYFMHPVKSRSVIKTARRVYGLTHYVVDHPDELEKILEETRIAGGTEADFGELVILVRVITPPAEGTLLHLSSKFGANPVEAAAILQQARVRGCRTGIAFHVGSQCCHPEAFITALKIVGEVIEMAGVEVACLDVGGGFPVSYANVEAPPLEDFFEAIRAGVAALELGPDLELLCEPGRALVAEGCSLLTQVHLRKGEQLYINDGIYGSLSELGMIAIEPPARLIRLEGEVSPISARFTINGPTCDSIDVLPCQFTLPDDVREGDWIEIARMGAYSSSAASRFNGFSAETFIEVGNAPS